MVAVIRAFESYLHKAFGIEVKAKPWKGEQDLPFFLRELYAFYEVALLGKPCVVIIPRGNDEITSATLIKHFKQLQAKWTGLCIFVHATISSYNRKRLIEHRIPFVIPNNQMYIPDIGTNLTEHYLKERSRIKILSPATQTVIIYALLHGKNERFLPSELAKELHYTAMTMTRALDELESIGIGEIFQQGKERWLRFIENKNAFWQQIRPFMHNPVKKRVWLRANNKGKEIIKRAGVIAGLTALAHRSMLNQPAHPVYATDMKAWKALMQSKTIEEVPSPEEADVQLEIWSYYPKLFAKNGAVDSFSLYLSLQDNKDERVEAALEKLMEQIKSDKELSLVPIHAELTTQEAANLLNVSRSYLIRLFENKKIPFHKVGRHRRVLFRDLIVYREKSKEKSRKARQELTEQAQDFDLGY